MTLDKSRLLHAFRRMKMIREFEERLHVEIATGEIPGFTHLYAGQEAIAVGVCEQFSESDYIGSTHRGHGHCIAKGCDVVGMMKEIYGRQGGLCNGKGGSMHIADMTKGMLGANAIVGGGPPIAVGAAIGSNDLAGRWRGFGMPAERVDGADCHAVFDAMGRVVQRARSGAGPSAIEAMITRFYGHFEGDPQNYRAKDEVAKLRMSMDCLKRFRARMLEGGPLSTAELDAVDAEAIALIDRAVIEAKAAPPPPAADLYSDVYINY